MVDALQEEIASVRAKGYKKSVQLRSGRLVRQIGGRWCYQFEGPSDIVLRVGAPIMIVVGAKETPADLVGQDSTAITISTELGLGDLVDEARLKQDESFLLERLAGALRQTKVPGSSFNHDAAERMISGSGIETRNLDPDPKVVLNTELNPEQLAAIRQSLGSQTTFIWGPPGTGKTKTVAHIVEAHYRAGRTVLLVSNTNSALDLALRQVVGRLSKEKGFTNGLIVRHGLISNLELRQTHGNEIELDAVTERKGKRLLSRLKVLEANEISLTKEKQVLERIVLSWRKLEAKESEVRAIKDRANLLAAELLELSLQKIDTRHRLSRLASERDHLDQYPSLVRLIYKRRIETILREFVSRSESFTQLEANEVLRIEELEKNRSSQSLLSVELAELQRETQGTPNKTEAEVSLAMCVEKLAKTKTSLTAISETLATLRDQILSKCRILAATAYQAYLTPSRLRLFDTVVIDEASMLMPPLAYFAAGLSSKFVTIVGDFRQLGPIVSSEHTEGSKLLSKDVFEMAGIPSSIHTGSPTPHLICLRTQYRMIQPILHLVNHLFYDDQPLKNGASFFSQDFPGLDLGEGGLCYVDTSALKPTISYKENSSSRFNILHAMLVSSLVGSVSGLHTSCSPDYFRSSLGVITPFKAQARLIQSMLTESYGDKALNVCSTVHTFQGSEKNVVLLDLTESRPSKPSKFARAVEKGEPGSRLYNVAISRAKRKLVVIGNFTYIQSCLPPKAILRRCVEWLLNEGTPIPVQPNGFSPSSALSKFPGSGLGKRCPTETRSFEFFSEVEFQQALKRDILCALKSVVIVSPFLTARGTERYLQDLRDAIKRGVTITLLTALPSPTSAIPASDAEHQISRLREIGVRVKSIKKLHTKAAVIDMRTAWYGSLNILSHLDTKELMSRCESEAVCKVIREMLAYRDG